MEITSVVVNGGSTNFDSNVVGAITEQQSSYVGDNDADYDFMPTRKRTFWSTQCSIDVFRIIVEHKEEYQAMKMRKQTPRFFASELFARLDKEATSIRNHIQNTRRHFYQVLEECRQSGRPCAELNGSKELFDAIVDYEREITQRGCEQSSSLTDFVVGNEGGNSSVSETCDEIVRSSPAYLEEEQPEVKRQRVVDLIDTPGACQLRRTGPTASVEASAGERGFIASAPLPTQTLITTTATATATPKPMSNTFILLSTPVSSVADAVSASGGGVLANGFVPAQPAAILAGGQLQPSLAVAGIRTVVGGGCNTNSHPPNLTAASNYVSSSASASSPHQRKSIPVKNASTAGLPRHYPTVEYNGGREVAAEEPIIDLSDVANDTDPTNTMIALLREISDKQSVIIDLLRQRPL